MAGSELEVLVEQLDELLVEGAVDASDALEIAVVAGLAARLGASPEAMAGAVAWRDGVGAELLAELWEEIDLDALVEGVDACVDGATEDDDLEDAISDFDDVVAAAVWCGKAAKVKAAAKAVCDTISKFPDTFASIAPVGLQMALLHGVAERYELYAFWMALADTARQAPPEAES